LAGRLIAAVAAIALIFIGLALRGSFSDDSSSDSGGGSTPSDSGDGDVLACTEGLEDVCRAVKPDDWTIQMIPSAITSSVEVAAPGAEVALWITFGPWDSIRTVDDATNQRTNADMPAEGEAIAVSPLVTVAWSDRATVLETACGKRLWECVRQHGGQRWSDFGGESRWGQMKLGLSSPASSSLGAAALSSYVGDTLGTMKYSAARLRDASVVRAMDSLDSVLQVDRNVLNAMITRGPASVDAAVVTEAEAVVAFRDAASRAAQVQMSLLEPNAYLAVKLVPISGDRNDGDVRSKLTTELIGRGGWRDPTTLKPGAGTSGSLPPLVQSGLPSYTEAQGLPPVGVIEATRQAWVATAG